MDIACLLAALLFFVGQIVYIIYNILQTRDIEMIQNIQQMKDLDPDLIQSIWYDGRKNSVWEATFYMMNAVAWALFAVPMIQLCWILSLRGKRLISLHVTMFIFTIVACLTEFLSFLFIIGMNGAVEWSSKTLNLHTWLDAGSSNNGNIADMIGWRVLQLIVYMYSGMVMWIDTFEWFAICIVLMISYISVRGLMINNTTTTTNVVPFTFGKIWAHLGLFISLLSFIQFFAQGLSVAYLQIGGIALLLGISLRMFLFPLWLCLLSNQLSIASHSMMTTMMEETNNKVQDQQQQSPSPNVNVSANVDTMNVGDPGDGEFVDVINNND